MEHLTEKEANDITRAEELRFLDLADKSADACMRVVWLDAAAAIHARRVRLGYEKP
jgi:hypothetical protein